MQLTVLIDNISHNDQLNMEHGLSYHIDNGISRILFDTGQSGAFHQNALKLGISISKIDYLVISHGHFDHIGGIEEFLKFNNHAKILLKPEALHSKFSNEHYIGIPHGVDIPAERLIQIGAKHKIDDVSEIIGKIDIAYSDDTHYDHFFVQKNNEFITDTFQDEVFLALKSNGSITIITGCSHKGISNIVQTAITKYEEPIRYIFGGFHLKDSKPEETFRIADYLNKLKLNKIVTGHCTGMENYLLLKNRCQIEVHYGFTGSIFTF